MSAPTGPGHAGPSGGWSDIDAAPDPAWYATYLDDASTGLEARKWARHALLGVSVGDLTLDIGCGTGGDVITLAALTGRRGLAVGVDHSQVVLRAAASRARPETSARFVAADAHHLPFRDGAFDSVSAERVLQHLRRPTAAAGEMLRVVRPGGRVLATEPDSGMTAVDADDGDATNAILAFRRGEQGSRFLGRQLAAVLHDAGLRDVHVEGAVDIVRDRATAESTMGLREAAERAVAAGVIDTPTGDAWIRDQQRREEEGRFLTAWVRFTVVGSKPGGTPGRGPVRALMGSGAVRAARLGALHAALRLRTRLGRRSRSRRRR